MLQMLKENVVAFGCAYYDFKRDGFHVTLTACNYSAGNMQGEPTYEFAWPFAARKCKTGTHKTYTSLCSENEVY